MKMELSTGHWAKYKELREEFQDIRNTQDDLTFIKRLEGLNALADELKEELESELEFVKDFYAKYGGSGRAI